MASASIQGGDRRWFRIVSLVVRILLALAFAGSGIFKLSGHPMVVDEFARVGLGQWFRYVVALIELSGAVLLVWPTTVAFGAMTLGAVCAGAFFAQILRIHIGILHTIVLGTICAVILWIYRSQLLGDRRG